MIDAVCDWESAFCEQITRIQKEIQIARRNNDNQDITNLQKWLTATSKSMQLNQEGVSIEEIPQRLQSAGIDLDFPECEEFFRSLEEDDFELMLDW